MAQEKRRHFVIEHVALRALCEVARRVLKLPVLRNGLADCQEGSGNHSPVPIGVGNQQELATQIAQPLSQRAYKVDR